MNQRVGDELKELDLRFFFSFFFFFKILLLLWTIFKVLIEFVTILLLFHVLVFVATWYVGSQVPDQGFHRRPLHWKVKS